MGDEGAELPVLEAELFERRMTAGRTKPIALFARTSDETLVHCVVKARPRLAMAPLEYALEWMGAMIARRLGIDTPDPYAVRITSGFAASVTDAAARVDLAASVGLVFGAAYVGAPFTQMVKGLVLSEMQRAAAARVLGFDLLVLNPDRRGVNPNLFLHRSRILAFDHEQAFSFLLPIIGAPDPATDPALPLLDAHVFRHALRKEAAILAEVGTAITNVDDAYLDAVASSVPAEWTIGAAQGKLTTLLDVIRRRRDAVGVWLPQVEACLTR